MNQNRPDDERTTRIVTLDFNGGSHVYRNPELGMNIPVRITPSGISADRARMLAEALNGDCADSHVRFEVGASSTESKSSVRIGRTSDFDRYGAFLGLAEGIGSGDAFVLLDDSANDAELVDVIRHEAGHILGTLDHGGAGLARYAWEHVSYDYHSGFAYLANEKPDQYKILLSEVKTTNYVVKPIVAQSGEDYLVVSYNENGTIVEYNYSAVSLNSEATTQYITRTSESEIYLASGIWARDIRVNGGLADHCSAGSMTVSGNYDYDSYSRNTPYRDGESTSKEFNYKFYQGVAIGCDVTPLPPASTGQSEQFGTLTVTGNGVAKQCTAYNIVLRGQVMESYHEYYSASTNSPSTVTTEYKLFNGRAENCTVDGGWLEVKYGGIANDTIVKGDRGWAVIGSDQDIAMWRKEAEKAAAAGEEPPYLVNIASAEADFAQFGSAKANNLIVENGNAGVYYGGELHNARIDGFLYVGEGASLSGVITCKGVEISNVVPKTNITIKVDLNDYKVANYTEYLHDEDGNRTATVYYYADRKSTRLNSSHNA